jgi:hypothetical protein
VNKFVKIAPVVLGLTLALTACGDVNGRIDEVETGRNGVKVEVRDGTGSYEAYLIPDTVCEEGDYIQDCADADDYLVSRDGARPGRNGRDR